MISCRWCGAECDVVLDLGEQPAADLFPRLDDPLPDPVHLLRMALCRVCGLAQLAEDATVPDEPRAVEPKALRDQAIEAVRRVAASGLLPASGSVCEFGSPHGGSWEEPLGAVGLTPASGLADVVVDVFGMMHIADQRAAFSERVAAVSPGGLLLMQFHSLAAIVSNGSWNALRHGHFAYYSAPALIKMAAELGWAGVGVWEFPLYGGTVLLALREGAPPTADVAELVDRERAVGVLDPRRVSTLNATASSTALREFLESDRDAGRTVAAYGAASRAAALLQRGGIGTELLPAVADASTAKQGRALPVSRIPIISPEQLVEQQPDRVLLFVSDMLEEVRDSLPEVEEYGGRWVVLAPEPRLVDAD